MTQTPSPELLPCPFCGARGDYFYRDNPLSKWRHSIDCSSSTCGMSGPVESSRSEAIRLWNSRPAPTGESIELREKVARTLCELTVRRLHPQLTDRQVNPMVDEGWDRWGDDADAILALLHASQPTRDEVLEEAAKVAESFHGKAKRDRIAKGWKMSRFQPHERDEIAAEENGENIAAEQIAASIRALKGTSEKGGGHG